MTGRRLSVPPTRPLADDTYRRERRDGLFPSVTPRRKPARFHLLSGRGYRKHPSARLVPVVFDVSRSTRGQLTFALYVECIRFCGDKREQIFIISPVFPTFRRPRQRPLHLCTVLVSRDVGFRVVPRSPVQRSRHIRDALLADRVRRRRRVHAGRRFPVLIGGSSRRTNSTAYPHTHTRTYEYERQRAEVERRDRTLQEAHQQEHRDQRQ